ncbi:MAG: hypothetical protein KGJ90_02210 [Patescibacteria group bacterium]|nr:hypothetical protein [Patescibacteria group bacterium]
MSVLENLKKFLRNEDAEKEIKEYYRRNIGKKILAKTTMPTEEAIKQQEAQEGK